MTPGLCSVGDAGAAGLLGYDVLVSLLETVLSFLLALGILFRWGLKYFGDLGPWAFWVYIGVLVGILLWAVIIRLTRGRPQGSDPWRLERQPEAGQPKRGLEIHWPSVFVLLALLGFALAGLFLERRH